MKFKEFRLTCDVIDMSKPPVIYDPVAPGIMRYRGSGPIPCLDCGWKPDPGGLDDNGRCILCQCAQTRRLDAAVAFTQSDPKQCYKCKDTFLGLNSAYCSTCKQELVEEATKASRDAAISRMAKTTPDGNGVKIFGPYFCSECSRYGAVGLGKKCPECDGKGMRPKYSCYGCGEFNSVELGGRCLECRQKSDARKTLQKFICKKCYQVQACVLGGTCKECSVKIGFGNGQSFEKEPVPLGPPRLVRYDKGNDGQWVERVIPMGFGRPLSMEDKLGVDGRLGASHE